MKKIAFGILIALIAASPAVAAKKSKKAAAAEQQSANPNDASWRFFRDSLPIYLPTAVKVMMYPPGNNSK